MRSSSGGEQGKDRGLDDTMDLPGAPRRDDAGPTPMAGARIPDYDGLQPIDPRHYVIEQQIARGGMGRIFAARDRRLGRAVAIKVLLRGRSDESRRFEQEARITARLQHPAIVNVYEAGTWTDGEPFYAMKMVSGRSLADVVAEQRSLTDRLGLLPHMIAVADALAYAHSLRVIHRDLKPSNVLVGEFGETVVIDWGLAKDLGAASRAPRVPSRRLLAVSGADTGDGAVMGTPAWMSPEKARGDAVDEQDDVYAIGALLYYVMTGVPPYTGDNQREIVDRVLAAPPAPLEELQPGVPADLVAVIAKAMAREPSARYRSAAELAADLKRFQTGQLVGAHRYSPRERVIRLIRRHRTALAVAVAAMAVLVVIGAVAVARVLREKKAAQADRRVAEVQRELADEQRAKADRASLDLLEEQGRQALFEHHAGRALTFLAEAYEGGSTTQSLRFLLAEAARPFEAQRRRLAGHVGRVTIVAFDPEDGKRLASGGDDGAVLIWDASTGAIEQTLRVGAPVTDVAWCEDGSLLVTASVDGLAQVWDVGTGVGRAPLVGHEGEVTSARFAPGCASVVTAGADGTARVWQARTSLLLRTLRGHEDRVVAAEFAPDGRSVLTASLDGTARVWRTNGGQVSTMRHDLEVYSAHYDLTGARIVTASRDGTARIWSAAGDPLQTLEGHRWPVYAAEFSPKDGALVVTASRDGTARVWETTQGRLIAVLGKQSERLHAARFSSGGELVVTASRDGMARVYSAQTGMLLTVLEGHGQQVLSAEFDPHGLFVATASADGTVRLWDAVPHSEYLVYGADVAHVGFDQTGERVVGSSKSTGYVSTTRDRAQRVELSGHKRSINTISFSPDGLRVVTASEDGTAAIWDAHESRPPLTILSGHRGPVTSAAFSPDGTSVVTSGADGIAIVWDATTGAERARFVGHGAEVRSAAFDPTGTQIVTASWDDTVKEWDAESGAVAESLSVEGVIWAAFAADGRILTVGDDTILWRQRRPSTMERYPADCAAVSPDGRWVVTGGLDGIARIFDATSGKLLATRSGVDGPINAVAFHPNGERIIVAAGKYARLWSVPLETDDPQVVRRFVAERVPARDRLEPSGVDP